MVPHEKPELCQRTAPRTHTHTQYIHTYILVCIHIYMNISLHKYNVKLLLLTCPNMYLPLWTSHSQWLSLSKTAFLLAPPWCQSLQLSNVRWVARRCHVDGSSHNKSQRKTVKVGRYVIQLKLRVSRDVLDPPRHNTSWHVLDAPFTPDLLVQPSLISSPWWTLSENALLFRGRFWEKVGFAVLLATH